MKSKYFGILFLACVLALGTSSAAFGLDPAADTGYLTLVNDSHLLAETAIPDAMQDLSQTVPTPAKAILLRPVAAENYIAMMQALATETGNNLIALSGYRSAQSQKELFDEKLQNLKKTGVPPAEAVAAVNRFTALPGASEHQTGLAVDVSNGWRLEQSFADTASGRWLKENCWRFGYLLRYPEQKSELTNIAFEPWHFRYVGQPHAQLMQEQDWCLEEYIRILQTEKEISFPAADGKTYEIYWTDDPTAEFAYLVDFSTDHAGGYIVTVCYPPEVAAALAQYHQDGTYLFRWSAN